MCSAWHSSRIGKGDHILQAQIRRDKYVRDGGRLGKPKGVGIKSKEQLQTEYKGVIKNLRVGQSVRNTAKITGVSQSTVQRLHNMHLYPILTEM